MADPRKQGSDEFEGGGEEEETSRLRQVATVVALGAFALAAYLVLFGGEPYKVTAKFSNAAQLVGGNEVTIGGAKAGSVEKIELGDRGEALVTISVTDDYAPLDRGTKATVRLTSLSGIANRHVELTLPPAGEGGEEIPDGGTMEQSETVSAVDLDQIFNAFDDRTVANLKKVIQGFEISYDGAGPQANRGYKYLNPFLSSTRRVFGELARDERTFERLIVDTSRLSGAVAQRAPDVSALVGNLNRMMGAIGRQKDSLSSAVAQLPRFMREFNTTAVNLRSTLDDVDPLVDASKPVAPKLRPFFANFRAAAADAVPAIRDTSRIVRRPGKRNDLIELTKAQVPLAEIAVGEPEFDLFRAGTQPCDPGDPGCENREGAFPAATNALGDSLPVLAHLRAYTPELVGWFNDFGPISSVYDANGGIGRISTSVNQFTASLPGLPEVLPLPSTFQNLSSLLLSGGGTLLDVGHNSRCPGSLERPAPDGSNPFTDGGTLDCDPSQLPKGP